VTVRASGEGTLLSVTFNDISEKFLRRDRDASGHRHDAEFASSRREKDETISCVARNNLQRADTYFLQTRTRKCFPSFFLPSAKFLDRARLGLAIIVPELKERVLVP